MKIKTFDGNETKRYESIEDYAILAISHDGSEDYLEETFARLIALLAENKQIRLEDIPLILDDSSCPTLSIDLDNIEIFCQSCFEQEATMEGNLCFRCWNINEANNPMNFL